MRLRGSLLAACAVGALLVGALAHAQQPQPIQQQEGQPQQGQPALVTADQLSHDEALGLVVASGNVELAQGGRVVMADTVTFNQRTNVVTASGNVRMIEPNGDVFFGEYVELTDDLKRGFIDQVRVLLTDNTRVAGAAAERTDDGRFVRVNRAVYSPCNLCAEDPTRAPVWQIRSARTTHDRDEKQVTHRDAQIEILGIPILYTPYLSHPDPTVERRSGFLAPTIGRSSELGSVVRNYYYWDIAPGMDATIEGTWTGNDGPLVGAQFRRRFERGSLTLDGSTIHAERRESVGGRTVVKEEEFRYHLFGSGRYDLTDEWRTGFDIQRTSDDTYLRRYGYSREDLLTSRAYLEGFRGRHFAQINTYSFQDLRTGNAEEEPVVLPQASFSMLGQPNSLMGGRWSLDGALVALRRDQGNDYRRVSLVPGWQGSWYHSSGLVATLTGLVRGDVFYTDDYDSPDQPGGRFDDTATGRILPVAQLEMRYPLVGQIGAVQPLVEPIVAFTTAPRIGQRPSIPNEDSRTAELTATNLFRLNRFSGVDRFETGNRVTYGLNTGVYGQEGRFTRLFVGQSYSFGDNGFAPDTGLGDGQSDYVARLVSQPSQYLSFDYSVTANSDDLSIRRQELTASAGVPALRVGAGYFYVADTPSLQTDFRNEYLTVSATSQLTPNWSLSMAQSRDLSTGGIGPLATSAAITYQDECIIIQGVVTQSNIRQADLNSGTSFFVRFVLRDLGEIATPSFGIGSLFGGSDVTTR